MFPGDHICYGCLKQVESDERHIHFGLDEWSAKEGLAGGGFGLDDLLNFTYCEACTEKTENGWPFEAHEIEAAA